VNTHRVSGDDSGDKQRWWRRPAVITAVAIVVVALVIAGGVLLGRDSHTSTVAAVSSPSAASTLPAVLPASPSVGAATSTVATSTSTAASPSEACPVGLVSDVLPASAPADVVWRATSVAPVPYSKTWGPYRATATGLPRCFSHSPTGAVIAAVSINTWLFSTQWRTVLAAQVARTPGYTELLSALSSQPPDGSAQTDTVAGFTVAAYTATAATVEVVERSPNGGTIGCPLSEEWINGDWRLTPRPDGTLTEDTCPAVTAAAYIPWGPDQ